jgi:hypothetical protein
MAVELEDVRAPLTERAVIVHDEDPERGSHLAPIHPRIGHE